MLKSRNIITTTTPSIEGRNILRYFGPINANVVLGTNIFSDILAEVTDIVGGQSESYQNKLDYLYSQVIEKIKKVAEEQGANGIVGLTIDINEISGKGKSMFMISALGTSILLEGENPEIVVEPKEVEQKKRISEPVISTIQLLD